jgi:hypothetical protein
VKEHPYLTFGIANDEVSLAALALGALLFALTLWRGRQLSEVLEHVPTLWFVGSLAFIAAVLSTAYLAHYLEGGPRIIDATAYYLEGRVFSTGRFAFDVPEPSGSFRGRFLLPTADGRLGVIFPPGYPLLLAAGFVAGAPLAIGPLLAGALVICTYTTTRTLLTDERVARMAALLSTLCAALRYHTADTMSHGFSALLLTFAVGAAARRTQASALSAGLALGWLVATRPVSGAAAALLVVFVLRRRLSLAPALLAGFVPGVALLLTHARTLTGSWFGSTQLRYYALADGPPGCFRYGFGEGVGCRFEHGDFVKAHLESGFGALEAAWVTFDRLVLHAIDVANFAPLALLVPWAALRFRHERNVRALALGPLLVVLAYVPFYYPGSYPGAGARLYTDAIPLEHALVALALVRLDWARFAPPAVLLGFALHGVHQHVALAERDGGRPMFDSNALGAVATGLVFVESDHGFMLGHDPSARDATRSLIVARRRRDAHDAVLWQRLGRPRSYHYDYDPERGTTRVVPYVPESTSRYEAEAEWPPLAVGPGWSHPDFRPCLSRGQGLHVRKATSPVSDARIEVELVAPERGKYDLEIGWLADPPIQVQIELGATRAELVASDQSGPGAARCSRDTVSSVALERSQRVAVEASADVIIDYIELKPAETKKR